MFQSEGMNVDTAWSRNGYNGIGCINFPRQSPDKDPRISTISYNARGLKVRRRKRIDDGPFQTVVKSDFRAVVIDNSETPELSVQSELPISRRNWIPSTRRSISAARSEKRIGKRSRESFEKYIHPWRFLFRTISPTITVKYCPTRRLALARPDLKPVLSSGDLAFALSRFHVDDYALIEFKSVSFYVSWNRYFFFTDFISFPPLPVEYLHGVQVILIEIFGDILSES